MVLVTLHYWSNYIRCGWYFWGYCNYSGISSNAPSSLRYYCTVHGNGTGNTISVVNNNMSTVASNMTDVNNVGSDITNVNTVATDLAGTDTIGTCCNRYTALEYSGSNLSGTDTIGTVATDIANVNAVGTDIANTLIQ